MKLSRQRSLPIRIQFGIFRLPPGREGVSAFLYVTLKYAVAFLLVVIESRELLCFVLLLQTVDLLVDRFEYCLGDFLLPPEMTQRPLLTGHRQDT